MKPSPSPNRLCRNCLRSCCQPEGVLLVDCPRYLPRPFKVQTHRFDQLDLFASPAAKPRRRT